MKDKANAGNVADNAVNKEEGTTKAEKKKMSKLKKIGIITAAVVIVGALTAAILARTIWGTNSSAKMAASHTFDAIYGCDFDLFVKASIYNSECMPMLGLDLNGQLNNQIRPSFDQMRAYMEKTGESYKRRKATVEEFDRGDSRFETGLALMKEEQFDVYDGAIEKMARVVIEFDWHYMEGGKRVSGVDTEAYWCVRIDGKWYAWPGLIED